MDTQIIKSLLDIDFYKLTMLQFIHRHFGGVPVVFSFLNRTKEVDLTRYISEAVLREEIARVRDLSFTDEEVAYLAKNSFLPRGFFTPEFLGFLKEFRLPEPSVVWRRGNYAINVSGSWAEATLWETLILSLVNELYYRGVLAGKGLRLEILYPEGEARLRKKIAILEQRPHVAFSDFGTRRRFSRTWQEHVVRTLSSELPKSQMLGTSNVLLAKEFDLRPIGTFAHELYMVFSGIFRGSDAEMRNSHNMVLRLWWEMYGEPLSIALTDTYGTDFFFRDFTDEQARKWRALRHDSGDPVAFGKGAIAFYRERGIDPREKTLVFSDGLDIDAILAIHKELSSEIGVVFGWGTNLTNDLGPRALSLVMKVAIANGNRVVKLSDNIAKATGDPLLVERYKRVFGYASAFNEYPVY